MLDDFRKRFFVEVACFVVLFYIELKMSVFAFLFLFFFFFFFLLSVIYLIHQQQF